MKLQKILVIGGTGMLGFPVAKQLAEDGFEVSILTTKRDVAIKKVGDKYDFIQGDVKQPNQLQSILSTSKFDGIHINLASLNYKDLQEIEVEGTANIINAAKTTGIQKITLISGLGVQERNSWVRSVKAKLKIEKTVVEAGIPYTIFNCTHFMESIPKYSRNGKISIIGKQAHPVHWVAASDYAKMVSRAFSSDESNNKIISVMGPEPITMKEAFLKYIELVDPTLKYAEVPLPIIKMMAFLTFNKTLKYVADLMEYFDRVAENPAENTLNDVLGIPETTLEDWLKDRANKK